MGLPGLEEELICLCGGRQVDPAVDGAVVLVVERRGRARVLLERGIFFQVGVVDGGMWGCRSSIRNSG